MPNKQKKISHGTTIFRLWSHLRQGQSSCSARHAFVSDEILSVHIPPYSTLWTPEYVLQFFSSIHLDRSDDLNLAFGFWQSNPTSEGERPDTGGREGERGRTRCLILQHACPRKIINLPDTIPIFIMRRCRVRISALYSPAFCPLLVPELRFVKYHRLHGILGEGLRRL